MKEILPASRRFVSPSIRPAPLFLVGLSFPLGQLLEPVAGIAHDAVHHAATDIFPIGISLIGEIEEGFGKFKGSLYVPVACFQGELRMPHGPFERVAAELSAVCRRVFQVSCQPIAKPKSPTQPQEIDGEFFPHRIPPPSPCPDPTRHSDTISQRIQPATTDGYFVTSRVHRRFGRRNTVSHKM